MKSYDHLKTLNRALTLAFATLGTGVEWNQVVVDFKYKGKPIYFKNANFEIKNENGNIMLPSMTSEELDDSGLESPFDIDEDITKFVNNIFKSVGDSTRYPEASLTQDFIFYELIEAIRNAPSKQSTKVLEGLMRSSSFNSTLYKARNMAPMLQSDDVRDIDKTLVAVAINNAKLMQILPPSFLSSKDLLESMGDGIINAMSMPSVRELYIEQALRSEAGAGAIVCNSQKVMDAYIAFTKHMNINPNIDERRYGRGSDGKLYKLDDEGFPIVEDDDLPDDFM